MRIPWRKKEEIDKSEIKVKTNTLTIFLANGTKAGASCNHKDNYGRITPWISFYSWFFGRESEHYMLRYCDGEVMIRRSDIKSFDVKIQ